MSSELDLLLCILPKVDPKAPTLGPPILKSHCISAGYSCMVRDLNIELYNIMPEDLKRFWRDDDMVFNDQQMWDEFYNAHCRDMFESWADQLIARNARWIGLSLLTFYSKFPAKALIGLIKHKNPAQQIVLGGSGVSVDPAQWLSMGVDRVVIGDAEEALIALLANEDKDHSGIIRAGQLHDLDLIQMPNYDDIDFTQYQKKTPTAFVTSSRGCVRNCDFCDVAATWPKYRFRHSQRVLDEILNDRQRYGIKNFFFTDALINGSLSNFRNLCKGLAEYRDRTGDRDWHAGGQFICRTDKQMPPDDYDTMSQAGFTWVSIGVESGSERIRKQMSKGFSNDDLWYTLEQLHRVGMHTTLMLIVGYPKETKEDFDETLNLIRGLADRGYLDAGKHAVEPIFFRQAIYPNTPLYDNAASLGISHRDSNRWVCGINNINVRLIRHLKASEMLHRCSGKTTQAHYVGDKAIKQSKSLYKQITGEDPPADILEYDESLCYGMS